MSSNLVARKVQRADEALQQHRLQPVARLMRKVEQGHGVAERMHTLNVGQLRIRCEGLHQQEREGLRDELLAPLQALGPPGQWEWRG